MRLWKPGFGIAAIAAAGMAAPRERPIPVLTVTGEQLEQSAATRGLAGLVGALPCRSQTIPSLIRPLNAARTTPGSLTCLGPVDPRMVDVYRAHNEARHRFGSQPLVWDPRLAAAAQAYAIHLARTGRLVHAPREGRGNARENLTMGLPGWNGRQLVSIWLNEQRYFRPGVFPNVTTTGNWADVSHFTQMVWPTTITLGCGIADGSGYRWLVCRYAPGGNKDGKLIAPATHSAGR